MQHGSRAPWPHRRHRGGALGAWFVLAVVVPGCGLILETAPGPGDASSGFDAASDTGAVDAQPRDARFDAPPSTDAGPADSSVPPTDAGTADAVMCSFEPCGLVAPQCGCIAGEACYFSVAAGCFPAGALPVDSSCTRARDCVPGAGCMSGGGLGSCRPYCDTPADCSPEERCIRLGPTGGEAGACEPLCDPLDDSGCPSGRKCILATSDTEPDGDNVIVTGCGLPGTIPVGSPCSSTATCIAGSACDGAYCRQLCVVGGVPCDGGVVCRPLDFERDGRRIGICM